MLAADLDITIGDNFWSPRWAVILDEQPVDLTAGWIIRAQIRPHSASAVVLHDFAADGLLLGEAEVQIGAQLRTTSTVQFYIPSARSERFTEWIAIWDWKIESPTHGPDSTPFVRTVAGGKVTTNWSVTR